MESWILNKKAFSLLEVTVIVLIIGTILSMLIPSYTNRINNANYQRTVNELTALAQASVNFYVSNGDWPITINQLAPQYIPSAVTFSPFGTNYQIVGVNTIVTASVLVPAGLAKNNPQGPLLVVENQGNQDLIEVSQSVRDELTSRLSYDLKYIN